MQLGISLLPFV